MLSRWRTPAATRLRLLLCLFTACLALPSAAAAGPSTPWGVGSCVPTTDATSPYVDNCFSGNVKFFDRFDAGFNNYLYSGNADFNAWYWSHADRAEWFDPNITAQYSNGLVYHGSYNIWKGSNGQPDPANAQYVLKSSADHTKPVYINFNCSQSSTTPANNTGCDAFAGDVANPAFRTAQVNMLFNLYDAGYFQGVWLDDVPIGTMTTDGIWDPGANMGRRTVAYSPYLGRDMTDADWRSAMHSYMDALRAKLPAGAEILANIKWDPNTAGGGMADSDALAIAADANYVDLEGMANDGNIKGGTIAQSTYSFSNLRDYVRRIHNVGTAVVWDDFSYAPADREWSTSQFLLNNAGNDLVGLAGQTPANWWAGYDVVMAKALNTAYVWNGLQRRDFTKGIVLANDPAVAGTSGTSITVTLPRPLVDTSGNLLTTITLAPRTAAILRDPSLTGNVNGSKRNDAIAVSDTSVSIAVNTNRGLAGPMQRTLSAAGTRTTLAGDVNGDGRDDLVKLDTNGNATVFNVTVGSTLSTTPIATGVNVIPNGTNGTFLKDVNGDGRADLVAWNPTTLYWAAGSAGGGFAGYQTVTLPAGFTGDKTNQLADMNGDGKADLVSWSTAGVVKVALSTGTGFGTPTTWISNSSFVGTRANLACDTTKDGKADLVAISNTVSTSVTNSGGTAGGAPLANTQTWTPGATGATYACKDMDGDGDADLVSWDSSRILVSSSLYAPSFGMQFAQRNIGPVDSYIGTKYNLLGDFDRE